MKKEDWTDFLAGCRLSGRMGLSRQSRGTEYDESQTCSHCGFGRRLVSPLRLDLTCVPKTAALAVSIGDERVASSAVVSALAALGARGCNFLPVSHRRADSEWESRGLHKHERGREILEAALAAEFRTRRWRSGVGSISRRNRERVSDFAMN